MDPSMNVLPLRPSQSKASPRRRVRRAPVPPAPEPPQGVMVQTEVIAAPALAAPQGVMGEVRSAFRRQHLLSTSVGVVFGGSIPVATYMVSHAIQRDMQPVWMGVAVTLTALGLLFSLPTVYSWGRQAFGAGYKALGFAGLAEGIMVTADHLGLGWMSVAMLVLLVFVNSVSCGTGFAFYRSST